WHAGGRRAPRPTDQVMNAVRVRPLVTADRARVVRRRLPGRFVYALPSRRRKALQLVEPVEDDVQPAGAGVVLDHQESLTIRADVVIGHRNRVAVGVTLLEEQSRWRECQLRARGDLN